MTKLQNFIKITLVPLILFMVPVAMIFFGLKHNDTLRLGLVEVKVAVPLVLLVAVFVISQSLLHLRPILKLDKTRAFLLDRESHGVIEEYKLKCGIELRMNLMLAKYSFLNRQEPRSGNPNKRRLKLFTKHLYPFWRSNNMDYDEDRNIRFTINQGVSGEAFRTGDIKSADLSIENPADYNLNSKQIRMTSEVRYVLSCPVYKLNHGTNRLTKEVIGIMNFDSKSVNAEKILYNDTYLADLARKIRAFSDLYSLLC